MSISHSSKTYHTNYYATHNLFEKGSWLEQCEPEILNIVKTNFCDGRNIHILDLGCGVGKNAIPIAQTLQQHGEITCVDILSAAISSLEKNAQQYGVSTYVHGISSPIETFQIIENLYDLILANSVLMFLENKKKVADVLQNMKNGSKLHGIHYISLSCDVTELNIQTQKVVPTTTELPFRLEPTILWLKSIYSGWDCILEKKVPYEEQYSKDGEDVLWSTTFLYIAFQKNAVY